MNYVSAPRPRPFSSTTAPSSKQLIGYEVAHGIAYYLGDPLAAASDDYPMEGLRWDLYRVDPATDQPVAALSWVHEVLLELDPTGREMRPPSR